ncbi:MAG: hypothetical protein RBS80_27300 [Thermoguttaceae bacterium]|jgi:hypothetical protein|nr:hypothetical protein [Thermoguttaceae bacterium]
MESTAVKEIDQVSYTSSSGPILPELQWHEEIVISRQRATLSRNGRVAETEVNAGSWECSIDEAAVTALFAQLAAVDFAAIRRNEPEDPPDGGDTESYVLRHTDSTEFALWVEPGVTYTHGELITSPVDAFIRRLDFPAESANRYRD